MDIIIIELPLFVQMYEVRYDIRIWYIEEVKDKKVLDNDSRKRPER
jgi:hypothetical protein